MIPSIQLNVVRLKLNAKLCQSKLSMIKRADKVFRILITKVSDIPGGSYILLGLQKLNYRRQHFCKLLIYRETLTRNGIYCSLKLKFFHQCILKTGPKPEISAAMVQKSLKELISNKVECMKCAIKLIELWNLITLKDLCTHFRC
jgi:hypothetical protein